MNIPGITASKLERLSLCPGSLAAERGLPDRTSDAGEAGKRIHAALAAYWRGDWQQIPEERLPEGEMLIVDGYIYEAKRLMEDRLGSIEISEARLRIEERLECVDGFTGQPDLVALRFASDSRKALILDWKTGWIEQEPSVTNLQLRAYAVLVALKHQVSSVEVALLQRQATTQLVRYELDDLIQAREEIREIIRGAGAPGAQRHAGETQCRYCRAIGICPEARAVIPEALAAVDPRVKTLPLDVLPEAVELLVQCLDAKDLIFIYERKKVAEMVFSCTTDEIKRRLEDDPKSVPGLALKPGNKVRKITDSEEALKLLEGLITPSEFASCCTVSLGSLEDTLRSAHGITIAKSKQALAERLAPVLEERQNQPSIVRAK